MFATVTVLLAQLVEHPLFTTLVTLPVALTQSCQLFLPIQFFTHLHPHRFGCHFPVRQPILFPFFQTSPSVSFILSQLGRFLPLGFTVHPPSLVGRLRVSPP